MTTKNKKTNDFAGFEDWIPVFAGGKQTDSAGNTHDGDELIDKAINSFDPEYHEPPAVIGHPKDNSPAYGSVVELKKEPGNSRKKLGKVSVLFAKFKDVAPKFAQAVKDGLFKKRSASFYSDGRLRHVGFLGGMPPAVKGLANLKFEEDEQAIEFNEQNFDFMDGWIFRTIGRMFTRFREYIIADKGVEEADRIISSYDIENVNSAADRLDRDNEKADSLAAEYTEPLPNKEVIGIMGQTSYTEEELQAGLKQEQDKVAAEFAEKEAAVKSRSQANKQAVIDFAEKLKTAKDEVKKELEAGFAEKQRIVDEKTRKKGIADFIQAGIEKGKILPAWAKLGMAEFMEKLGTEIIEFSEEKKEDPLTWFKNFMNELPKTVSFEEFAKRDLDINAVGNAGAKLEALTQKKISDAKEKSITLDYTSAFSETQKQNPELTKEYMSEFA